MIRAARVALPRTDSSRRSKVNHLRSNAGVAGVYNRVTYLPEKRQALEQCVLT